MWLAWGKGRSAPAAAPAGTAAGSVATAEAAPRPGWPAAIGLLVAIAGALGFVAFFIVGDNAQKIGGTLALGFLGSASPSPTGVAT